MNFHVPDKSRKGWEDIYKVKQSQYLCWFCNHPQYIRNFVGYLKNCEKCGSSVFYGME